MSEPVRWRDAGPEGVRDLLRDAPRTQGMTAGDRARTRARVARLAGVAAGVGSLAWLQGAAIGAGLGVLTVGAVEIGSAILDGRSAGSPPPVAAPASAPSPRPGATITPSVVEPPATPASASPIPSSRPAARTPEAQTPAAGEASATAPREGDTLAEEAALLERARASLGASPAGALAITEEHAARFPAGKLSVERELLAIDALRRLGRPAEARARGEALLSRTQGSLYEERLRKLLDGLR
jgi:hypothetical protein